MPNIPAVVASDPRRASLAFLAAAVGSLALRLAIVRIPPLPVLRLPSPPTDLDTGVVVLFVPVCALMLGLLVETVRLVVADGALPDEAPPQSRAILHWQDEEG
jgi:hypothetical protein